MMWELNLNWLFIGRPGSREGDKGSENRNCFTWSRLRTPHESILDATFTIVRRKKTYWVCALYLLSSSVVFPWTKREGVKSLRQFSTLSRHRQTSTHLCLTKYRIVVFERLKRKEREVGVHVEQQTLSFYRLRLRSPDHGWAPSASGIVGKILDLLCRVFASARWRSQREL